MSRRLHGLVVGAMLMLAPGVTAALGQTPARPLPSWAYPVPAGFGRRGPAGARGFRGGRRGGRRGPARGPAGPTPTRAQLNAIGPLQHVPGSSAGYTTAYIANLYNPPDWFPNDHPAMPPVVADGNPAEGVRACAYCHLPDGLGRPENESVAGLSVDYILGQLADFQDGLRHSASPGMGSVAFMVRTAKAVSPAEARAAAEYFASLKLTPWIRVIETATVPKTVPDGGMLVVAPGGGTEPIGDRVIEVSVNQKLTELRDPRSGFIAYAPPGSVARGRMLVTTGGNGVTIRCAICHGPDLRGLGNVPPIAGRSPTAMARQLIDIQTGARNGPWDQLMKEPVRKLTDHDIVDIVAYLASLKP